MSYDLKVLADNRDALLLAEVAAWLHDIGKCADAFLQPDGTGFKATLCQGAPHVNPHKAIFEPSELTQLPYWSKLSPKRGQCSRMEEAQHSTALWRTLHNLAIDPMTLDYDVSPTGFGNATVRELILWGRPLVSDQFQQFRQVLGNAAFTAGYLGRAHGAAHIEKEESSETSSLYLSSPFGFEYAKLEKLDNKLQGVLLAVTSSVSKRKDMIAKLGANFSLALGETRRPENEVTLWDWSSLVAALYKSAITGATLDTQYSPVDLRWRLLSIRANASDFLKDVTRLPDLLIRQQLLQNAFEQVRILLEETYPLGTEVYRDENGSLYVVPNLPDLLDATDAAGLTLQTHIQRAFSLGTVREDPALAMTSEIICCSVLDEQAWWGQRPDRQQPSNADEIPPVGRLLQHEVTTYSDAHIVANWWKDTSRDICPVCGLRPQAPPNTKAGGRTVCEVCERRRDDRSKIWTDNLATTIWTDEVADKNGRLALVVGQFDLDEWLDGTFVQTLTVTEPKNGNATPKNPSFARIRRIWETTRTFWSEITGRLQTDEALIPLKGERLAITSDDATALNIGPFHACELVVEGVRMSVVWDAPHSRFITADNLSYLAGTEQLGKPVAEIVRRGRTFALEEPAGYGNVNRKLGAIRIKQVTPLPDAYAPVIPILAEPRTFMALVPANKAMEVVQEIKTKYETEMGKVRNRLPLHLGVVYAGRRTPLASVLDAGRRMLRSPSRTVQAQVESVSPVVPWPNEVTLALAVDGRSIAVTVPTVMGDGTTHDVWYPYWQVAGKPTDRERWFVGPDGEHWVHICDLRQGDRVAYTPSTCDFEYLDASARRFEVAYGEDGRRLGDDKKQRPYLLEEVDALEQTWADISQALTGSQIKALESIIEEKRQAWKEPTGTNDGVSPVFRQFTQDALRQAKAHTPALEKAALSGMLADALEIHLTVHKDKPQKENS